MRVRRANLQVLAATTGFDSGLDVHLRGRRGREGEWRLVISTGFHSSSVGQDGKKKADMGDGSSKDLMKVAESGGGSKDLAPQSKSKVLVFVRGAAAGTWNVIRHPRQTWEHIKMEARHYYLGSKLLVKEVKIATNIVKRLLEGHGMTRRERNQLIRTTVDVFRVIPLSIFVLVPFMEFALPFALRLFPNMLPSTFQEKYQKEEKMKTELQVRLGVAGFFQDTLRTMAKKKRKDADEDETGALEISKFIEKARLGEPMAKENVLKIATHFKDELTLANINRPQLVSMCQYMGLPPYGADAFLRFQLRTKLRAIKEDDRRILWEGIETLTVNELRDACQERGMRASELSEMEYNVQLQEWLDLSIQKNIPIALLIMSRAFMLSSTATSSKTEDVLQSSMSSLDSDIINEVVLAASKSKEDDSVEMTERKLDSLQFQAEMIEEEREDTDEAIKHKKEEAEASSVGQESSGSTKQLEGGSGDTKKMKVVEEEGGEAAAALGAGGDESAFFSSSADEVVKTPESEHEDSTTDSAEKIATIMSGDMTKEEIEEEVKGLTIQEMQVLADLARGSSIEREKAELASIEAGVESAIAAAMAAKKRSDTEIEEEDSETYVVGDEGQLVSKFEARGIDDSEVSREDDEKQDEDEEDKSMIAMQTMLNKMMDGIKGRIDVAEKEFEASENTLPMLDLDGDGELSKEELKEAMHNLFKRTPTDAETEMMLNFLDKNKDGKVSISELLEYIDERRRKHEVEVLEADVKSKSLDN